MKIGIGIGVVVIVIGAGGVRAQAVDTFALRPIVVTATKVATPLSAVPAHVTVLRGDSLRALGYARVADALAGQAGIALAQLGSQGAVTSLFLRGGESDYVQVLVDGVQVNDPGGAFDWAHLMLADVERIEIVRGPASVLYGSDAVSGVVQVFTRRGDDAPRLDAALGAGSGLRGGSGASGSYGTWHGSAGVSGSARAADAVRARYNLGAARSHSSGALAFNNQYDNTTVTASAALQHTRGSELAFDARVTDQNYHYPTDGAGNVVDRNRYTDGTARALGVRAVQPLGYGSSAHFSWTHYRSETGGRDPEDEPGQGFANSSALVRRSEAELRVDAPLPAAFTGSLGAAYETQRGSTRYDSDGPFGPYSASSDDRRVSRAAFAQLVRARGALGITAGARLDDSDQFGTFGTARAGASLQLLRSLRLHASYGTGFKEPTFLETYATGFARGNPALEPEQSRSAELGATFERGRANLSITGFRQRFRNLIQYTFMPPTPTDPNYFNIGEARADGVELEAGARLTAQLTASAAYTYLHSEVLDEGFGEDRQFSEGLRLLRRPEHEASGTLSWRAGAVMTSLTGRYVGTRDDLDFTDPAEWQGKRVELPAHSSIDASAEYRLPLRADTRLRASVRNLLDARYDEVYNFPAARRLLEIGVSVTH